MALLEVKDLSFSYPGGEKKALDNLSFSVEEGELCLILSPNGGGKTTLLSLLQNRGDLPGKRSGHVSFPGGAPRTALLRQDADLALVTDKVWRELAFAPENRGLPTEEIRLRVAEAAGFLGLEPLFYRDVSSLSGSEKVKTLLAAFLADRPGLFLLDEPASTLDPLAKRDLAEALNRIRREGGGTVLLAEQTCDPFFAEADRVLYLENGALLFNGSPREAARFLLTTGRGSFVPESARLAFSLGEKETLPLTDSEGKRALSALPYTVAPLPRVKCAGEALLSLRDLSFRFEKNAPDLLSGLDLTLSRGEIVAVLGKGGSGKSTLLRLLSGELSPVRGKRRLAGGAKLAYLPQDVRCLFEKETLEEEMLSVSSPEKVREALSRFDLPPLAGRHPLDLSGGERQRAALAKLSLIRPDVLLLDEPTHGLDGGAKAALAALLTRWKQEGAGILLVTHDAAFAAVTADRCALLFNGEFAALEETDLFFRELHLFTTPTARVTDGKALAPEEVKAP